MAPGPPVPEIKAVSIVVEIGRSTSNLLYQIIGGYVFDSFLSTWTLLINALGLALSVSSGLSLGKEVNFYILIYFRLLPHLIVLGAISARIVLHVIPFHETFLKVPPKRRYLFPLLALHLAHHTI